MATKKTAKKTTKKKTRAKAPPPPKAVAVVDPVALKVSPDEVRLSIDAASAAFNVPGRFVRAALGDGRLGGFNYGGQTGWLTTAPAMRSFLEEIETPGLVQALRKEIADLKAELARVEKKGRKAA